MTPSEINKRVAEMMGECWHEWEGIAPEKKYKDDHTTFRKCKCGVYNYATIGLGEPVWDFNWCNINYCESIADAWKVVGWMRKKGYRMKFIEYTDGVYIRFSDSEIKSEIYQASQYKLSEAPMAICLAAIKVEVVK